MKKLLLLTFLLATPARADAVYLTYCPNIEGATCQFIFYQCTNEQHSTNMGDCVRQPDDTDAESKP